jgi:hypothetical protein
MRRRLVHRVARGWRLLRSRRRGVLLLLLLLLLRRGVLSRLGRRVRR